MLTLKENKQWHLKSVISNTPIKKEEISFQIFTKKGLNWAHRNKAKIFSIQCHLGSDLAYYKPYAYIKLYFCIVYGGVNDVKRHAENAGQNFLLL